MNVTLVYFSQTGNTRKVAHALAAGFQEKGHKARTVPLKKATAEEAASSDLLGVGTPTFSSQAPKPIMEFVNSLRLTNKQPAFIFATTGGAPGRVLYDLSNILLRKGADVKGGLLTRGEVHHPSPCLKGRFPNRPNAQDLASARNFAAAMAEHITASKPGLLPGSHPNTMKPQGAFYNIVALLSTQAFVRRTLPEPRLEISRCDQCTWCVAECPVKNITMSPYPVIEKNCLRCYRCLTGCPQEAFHVNWRVSNLGVWMCYNATFQRWFGDVKPGELVHEKE